MVHNFSAKTRALFVEKLTNLSATLFVSLKFHFNMCSPAVIPVRMLSTSLLILTGGSEFISDNKEKIIFQSVCNSSLHNPSACSNFVPSSMAFVSTAKMSDDLFGRAIPQIKFTFSPLRTHPAPAPPVVLCTEPSEQSCKFLISGGLQAIFASSVCLMFVFPYSNSLYFSVFCIYNNLPRILLLLLKLGDIPCLTDPPKCTSKCSLQLRILFFVQFLKYLQTIFSEISSI